MARHEVFYPMLLSEAPGCPRPALNLAINRAAAEFCQRSLAWQVRLEPIDVVAGTFQYDVEPPANSRLVTPMSVHLDDREILPFQDANSRRVLGQQPGDPTHYRVDVGWRTISLDPAPIRDGTLDVLAAFAPQVDARNLYDDLADRYYEAIVEGAKAIIKRMPNKPWSDPKGAADSYALFGMWCDHARAEAEAGFSPGNITVTRIEFGSH